MFALFFRSNARDAAAEIAGGGEKKSQKVVRQQMQRVCSTAGGNVFEFFFSYMAVFDSPLRCPILVIALQIRLIKRR